MKIEHNHSLELEDAKARLEILSEYWRGKYKVDPVWNGNGFEVSGKVMGISFAATVRLEPRRIVFEGPNKALMLKRTIKKYLAHKLGRYMDPATDLETLRADAARVAS